MLINNISVNILDVFVYSEKSSRITVTGARSYSALSFRTHSKSEFITGGRKLRAETGSIALVPGGIEYTRRTEYEEAIVFHFEMFGDADKKIEVFVPSNAERYAELFARALSIWEKKEAGFKYRATSVFYEILALMQSDGGITERSMAKKCDECAENAKSYIDLHFSDPRTSISSVAKNLFVSETYLRRVFTKRYGMPPKKYLDGVRTSHARSLIDSGICILKEVAKRCGFSDVKYFRTFFKSQTGVSPSEYRYNFDDNLKNT